MTELRRGTNEGVPFVVVELEDLHPINQAEHKATAGVIERSNRKAWARRLEIMRREGKTL